MVTASFKVIGQIKDSYCLIYKRTLLFLHLKIVIYYITYKYMEIIKFLVKLCFRVLVSTISMAAGRRGYIPRDLWPQQVEMTLALVSKMHVPVRFSSLAISHYSTNSPASRLLRSWEHPWSEVLAFAFFPACKSASRSAQGPLLLSGQDSVTAQEGSWINSVLESISPALTSFVISFPSWRLPIAESSHSLPHWCVAWPLWEQKYCDVFALLA